MQNEISLKRPGLIIQILTLILTGSFLVWALGPLSYEKAQNEEQLGHQAAKEGRSKEAFRHFLASAKIQDDDVSTSRRYRCAGSTSSNREEKIKYFQLALQYNLKNANAKNALRKLNNNVEYVNRYTDGWSKGQSSKATITVFHDEEEYVLRYYTSNPIRRDFQVEIFLDGKRSVQKNLMRMARSDITFSLSRGKHNIELTIDGTFNPKVLGMSQDGRDLGVHYQLIQDEAASG